MINYTRIIKECFNDLIFTEEDIKNIINGDDFRRKMFLFNKILVSSTHLYADMQIFNKDDLIKLIESYKVPKFNYNYVFRRLNTLEVLILGKELLITELKWQM